MSAYVSRAALKEAIGQDSTDTTDNSKLDSIVFRASALVDAYLDMIRPGYVGFAAGSNARSSVGSNTRYYDGTGQDWLFIDDASSVASVTVDGTAPDSTSWRTWPYNESPIRALVYLQPTSSLRGLTSDIWARGTANVAVTGYFGIPTVPNEVEACTIALGIVIWRRYERGEESPIDAMDPEVRAICGTYLSSWGIPSVGGA
jgi:hypothetical protein